MELCPVTRDPGSRASDVVRDMLGLAEGQRYWEALFLNSTQIFSLQMLFVIEGGYNESTLNAMTVGNYRATTVSLTLLWKSGTTTSPAAGPRRFFSETLMGDPQKLQELAEWMTQPARNALTALGHPTDALWVGIATNGKSNHPTGRFITDWAPSSNGRSIRWSERTGGTDNTGWRPRCGVATHGAGHPPQANGQHAGNT